VRCLIEAQGTDPLVDDILGRATAAAAAWGDVVPTATREEAVTQCRRRLAVAGLVEAQPAA
jgi:hypothetical protein